MARGDLGAELPIEDVPLLQVVFHPGTFFLFQYCLQALQFYLSYYAIFLGDKILYFYLHIHTLISSFNLAAYKFLGLRKIVW